MMKKALFLAALASFALSLFNCKGHQNEQSNDEDSTQTKMAEGDEEFVREHKAFDATTFFSTIKLGMTPEEVSNAMAELADQECQLEWEGLAVKFDFEDMTFDEETGLLRTIYFYTEPVGTGEYYFVGDGKYALYETKNGALSYEEIGKKVQAFAQMIADVTDGEVSDCPYQTYSYWSELGAGSIESMFNYEERALSIAGEESKVGRCYLRFTLQTKESYAG